MRGDGLNSSEVELFGVDQLTMVEQRIPLIDTVRCFASPCPSN